MGLSTPKGLTFGETKLKKGGPPPKENKGYDVVEILKERLPRLLT